MVGTVTRRLRVAVATVRRERARDRRLGCVPGASRSSTRSRCTPRRSGSVGSSPSAGCTGEPRTACAERGRSTSPSSSRGGPTGRSARSRRRALRTGGFGVSCVPDDAHRGRGTLRQRVARAGGLAVRAVHGRASSERARVRGAGAAATSGRLGLQGQPTAARPRRTRRSRSCGRPGLPTSPAAPYGRSATISRTRSPTPSARRSRRRFVRRIALRLHGRRAGQPGAGTLREMIEDGRRLVLLAENHAGAAPWYQLAYERLTRGDPVRVQSSAAGADRPGRASRPSCRPKRGPARAPLFLDQPLGDQGRRSCSRARPSRSTPTTPGSGAHRPAGACATTCPTCWR